MQFAIGTTSERAKGIESAPGAVGGDKARAASAAPAEKPARRFHHIDLASRLVLIPAVAALLGSQGLPYWTMKLAAPQYPRGLSLAIYPDRIAGDVDEIDGLNHYIGMRKIGTAAELERRLGIPMIVICAAC